MVLKRTAGAVMEGSSEGTSEVPEIFFLDLGSYIGVYDHLLKKIPMCIYLCMHTHKDVFIDFLHTLQ